jgi:hypothetical protein
VLRGTGSGMHFSVRRHILVKAIQTILEDRLALIAATFMEQSLSQYTETDKSRFLNA